MENAERDFSTMSSEKVIRLKYEAFVTKPVTEFARLAEFLNKDVPNSVNKYLKENIRLDSIGKGRKALGEAEVKNIRPLIADTLERYGYA